MRLRVAKVGEHAVTHRIDDAAAVVGLYPNGSTIRYRRRVVWTEGDDGEASASYDGAGDLVSVTDATTGTRTLVYDSDHLLTEQIGGRGERSVRNAVYRLRKRRWVYVRAEMRSR